MSNNNGIMKGKVLVKRPLSSERDMKFIVSKSLGNEIGMSIGIKPHNFMKGKVDITPRPRVIESLTPIKDSYTIENVPTYNYGNKSVIRVGVDKEGNKLRSYLSFDINHLYNIEKESLSKKLIIYSATLRLHVAQPYSVDMFEISTINKDYNEYGVTWSNQPSRDKFIDVVEVKPNETSISINVTDTVLDWFNKKRTNYGFLLKEFENTVGKQIVFHSREGSKPPELIIEYFDPNFGIPRRKILDIEFNVLTHELKDLPIKMNVITYKRDESLPIQLITVSKIGELYVQGMVTQPKLNLKAIICKNHSSSLPIELNVSQSIINEINTEFTITQNKIPLELTVRAVRYKQIEVMVHNPSIQLQMEISKTVMPIKMFIMKKIDSSINTEVTITRKSIPIEFKIIRTSSIPIRFAFIGMPDRPDQYLDIQFSYNKRNLPVVFEVRKKSDLPLEVYIISKKFEEKDIEMNIIKNINSDLDLLMNTRALNVIPFELDIKSRFLDVQFIILKKKQTFKNLEMNIKGISDLELNALIRKSKSILMSAYIKKHWFSDLPIVCHVDGIYDIRKSYVFIL